MNKTEKGQRENFKLSLSKLETFFERTLSDDAMKIAQEDVAVQVDLMHSLKIKCKVIPFIFQYFFSSLLFLDLYFKWPFKEKKLMNPCLFTHLLYLPLISIQYLVLNLTFLCCITCFKHSQSVLPLYYIGVLSQDLSKDTHSITGKIK